MSLEEKFNAAVNVIRSLPKSGSYQPSNELMLRFYSYYKQATEGPCDKPKPGFWDVVGRAKWESWDKLRDMSKEAAMQNYVEELQKIVETMSYNPDVASFLSVDDDDELRLVTGQVARDTPTGSVSGASSPAHGRRDSDDEFSDPIDDPQMSSPVSAAPLRSSLTNGHAGHAATQLTHLKVLEQLPGTLARLEADVAALRRAVEGDRRYLHAARGWRWPWQELSPPTLLLLALWPLLLYRVMRRQRRI